MISVKIGDLRNSLSAYLKKVRKGAEVIVMDRDTPIGRLIPYRTTNQEEPFELIPPQNGYASLAKLSFADLQIDWDPVADLLADRRRR